MRCFGCGLSNLNLQGWAKGWAGTVSLRMGLEVLGLEPGGGSLAEVELRTSQVLY